MIKFYAIEEYRVIWRESIQRTEPEDLVTLYPIVLDFLKGTWELVLNEFCEKASTVFCGRGLYVFWKEDPPWIRDVLRKVAQASLSIEDEVSR